MAVNASVLAMGQVAGLVLGGFLIDRLGWRSIYLLSLAVCALGLGLDLVVLPSRATGSRRPMDRWGAALSVIIVGAPFLLIERLSWERRDPLALLLLLPVAILVGLFVAIEQRPR